VFVRAEEDEVRESVVVSCVSRQELQCLEMCSQDGGPRRGRRPAAAVVLVAALVME